MSELLQQITDNTSPKQGFCFIVSGHDSRITTRLNSEIQLKSGRSYQIALVKLDTYYSFPNIHLGNNFLRYWPDDEATWHTVTLSTGSYSIDDINNDIQRQLRLNGHKAKIILAANTSTLRATLTLARNHQVVFDVDHSLNTMLGFDRRIYTSDRTTDGYTEGEHIVNIISVNSILVNNDIIHGSYVNSAQQPAIYSFFPNVEPGYKIVQSTQNLVYLPVTLSTIYRMETYLTNQDENPTDLRGEHLTKRFHSREV